MPKEYTRKKKGEREEGRGKGKEGDGNKEGGIGKKKGGKSHSPKCSMQPPCLSIPAY